MAYLQSIGRLIIFGRIKAETGLHIGSLSPGLQVGGIDLPVIRNPLSSQPFIPGSSLRGKIRSLLERHFNLALNKEIQNIKIHECKKYEEYKCCPVCPIFGVSVDVVEEYEKDSESENKTFLSRLVVRDALLNPDSADELKEKKTDLPFTEAKLEITVDRITAQAVPRTVERVPAGAFFDFEMVFNLFEENDQNLFKNVLLGMRLLEDDYLGGHGSRGSGRIKFRDVSVSLRRPKYYENKEPEIKLSEPQTIARLQKIDWVKEIQNLKEI